MTHITSTARHIITLPEWQDSKTAMRRNRPWIKILTGVDTTKSDGYAFIGEFAQFGQIVELDEGAYVMVVIPHWSSGGRLYDRTVTLYQVRDGELATVETWCVEVERGWALAIRDKIAAYVNAPQMPSVDELRAERERLLARLAEIEAMLPEPEGVEVDTRKAAEVLGISVRTVQRWVAAGKVAARKINGRWVITITITDKEDVDDQR